MAKIQWKRKIAKPLGNRILAAPSRPASQNNVALTPFIVCRSDRRMVQTSAGSGLAPTREVSQTSRLDPGA